MNKTEEIKDFFESQHRGRANPIKRRDLLPELQGYIPEIADRDMRKSYEVLPLCWCNEGIFIVGTEEERERQIEKDKKLIRAYAREIKVLIAYKIPEQPIQLGLFDGNGNKFNGGKK